MSDKRETPEDVLHKGGRRWDGAFMAAPAFVALVPWKPYCLPLEEICLAGCNFDDLPAEVCGEEPSENVLAKLREYFFIFKAHVEKDDG